MQEQQQSLPLYLQPMPWYLTTGMCMLWMFLIALGVTLLLYGFPTIGIAVWIF